MRLRKTGYNILGAGLIALAMAFAWVPIAHAGMLVTPERHILELAPGESGYVEYQIYNSGEEDVTIIIDPQDLMKIKENKNIKLDSWLKLKQTKIIAKPGKTATLGISITVPKNAVGELDAMLYLCYQQEEGSMLQIRYGTPLYILIKGTEKIEAKIKSAKVNTHRDPNSSRKRLIISVNVSNTGNRHIRPKVWARINMAGEKPKGDIALDKPWPVFGGQDYEYKIIWHDYNLEEGNYNCTAFFQYGDKVLEHKVVFTIDENGMAKGKKD